MRKLTVIHEFLFLFFLSFQKNIMTDILTSISWSQLVAPEVKGSGGGDGGSGGSDIHSGLRLQLSQSLWTTFARVASRKLAGGVILMRFSSRQP